jgi:RNA polymerase sigma factor (sigma-70 family)
MAQSSPDLILEEPTPVGRADVRLTAAEERAGRRVVAEYRGLLAWMLRVPEWETLFREGLGELRLPAGRRGVTADAALRALALEHKFELVRWAVARSRAPLCQATALQLCGQMGLDLFRPRDLDQRLSERQWQLLRERILFRLGQQHRRYKRAQRLLYCGFSGLVETAASQLAMRSRDRADCIQEGTLGLLQAIDRAGDSDQRFEAYALAWIRRRIRNFLLVQKLPVQAPVNRICETLAAGDAAAGDRDLALLLECLRQPAVSLDAAPDGELTGERIADPTSIDPAARAAQHDALRLVAEAVDGLSDKQREVLKLRYGLLGGAASTLSEVARRIGISCQQVSMRERRALQNLERILGPAMGEIYGTV